jgi:cellulose synthase/poly-beta-1,6-N-acetylglucosamine synthase-like glycosyltransferase
LFIDSDCEAHPDWIQTIYEEYLNDSFDACGGPDGAKDDFTTLQKAIDFAMTSFITTGGMRGHSEKMMAKFFPRTHNMGIKRSVYEKVGGFGDLRHGQDIELSNRIRKSGARIKFLINAVVYHRRRTSIKQFFKQVFNWGVARINLGKIDSSMLEPIHFLPSLATMFGFSIVGTAIYLDFPLDQLFLLIFIPLGLLSLFGATKKNDLRIFPYLLVVIPAQIIGYGLGFILNFIKRYILNQGSWTGFKKRYYA